MSWYILLLVSSFFFTDEISTFFIVLDLFLKLIWSHWVQKYICLILRSWDRGCSAKMLFWKFWQHSQENKCCGVSCCKKVTCCRPTTLIKTESDTSAFQRILRNLWNSWNISAMVSSLRGSPKNNYQISSYYILSSYGLLRNFRCLVIISVQIFEDSCLLNWYFQNEAE